MGIFCYETQPVSDDDVPFANSLCHRCAAPPKYVRTASSTFILCPLLPNKYPPQPVLRCDLFVPRPRVKL